MPTNRETFDARYKNDYMSWDEFKKYVSEIDEYKTKGVTPEITLTELNHKLKVSHAAFYSWVARARSEVGQP